MRRRHWATALGCAAAVAAVSAAGHWAGLDPGDDDRVDQPATVRRDGPLPRTVAAATPAGGHRVSHVSVPTAVGPAAGQVLTPDRPAPGAGWPGLVLVAGAGGGTAAAMLPWAERLADRGVATIVYDKRSQGYSMVTRDFQALAADAVAAARLLRTVRGVDPARVGAAGFSEGGWVVPLMAAQDADLATMVQLSGPGVTPDEQLAWQVNSGLLDASAPASARATVLRAMSLRFPGDVMAFGRFEPGPSVSAASAPLLSVYGLADPTVPVEDAAYGVLAARSALPISTTIRFFPGLGHGLADAGAPSSAVLDEVSAWVAAPPDGRVVSVRGGDAHQRHAVVKLPEPPGGLTTALLLASLAVLVGYGLNRAGRRGARSDRRTGRRLDQVATMALVTWVVNHLGLAVLAVGGALGAGVLPVAACWAVVKLCSAAMLVVVVGGVAAAARGRSVSGARRTGAVLAGLGGAVLVVIGGALTSLW